MVRSRDIRAPAPFQLRIFAMTVDTAAIRDILAQHGRLAVDVAQLNDDSDIYLAGLTSLATVGVMLALEDHFNIEFPEATLGRKTFMSINAIADAVGELLDNSSTPVPMPT
jgi:acyl carrier protein